MTFPESFVLFCDFILIALAGTGKMLSAETPLLVFHMTYEQYHTGAPRYKI